ncbi:hypothetical protein GQX74_003809 [Glossina fuscipes]|nr:hypothetical protein GQX74_003809 [Glossina fuscipes]
MQHQTLTNYFFLINSQIGNISPSNILNLIPYSNYLTANDDSLSRVVNLGWEIHILRFWLKLTMLCFLALFIMRVLGALSQHLDLLEKHSVENNCRSKEIKS